MKPMESPTKPGMMAKLRNSKGFSLIEMAVVLVIIGIIIGAILKGQDLMTNARAKQVISATNTWRVLTLAFLDRNGRLPGDWGKDGVIGSSDDGATSDIETNIDSVASAEIASVMTNTPANPITAGSLSFYVYFGSVPGNPTSGGFRNVMVLCKNSKCDAQFTKDELEIIKAVDTAQDGSADGGLGVFRSANTIAMDTNNRVILGATMDDNLAAGSTKPWNATNNVAAVWAFDRPF